MDMLRCYGQTRRGWRDRPGSRPDDSEAAGLFAIGMLLVGLLSTATVMQSAEAAVQFLTVVSLTFDDAHSDQAAVRDQLANHGMKGTFYVNSDRIGAPGYLTMAQLDAIFADGNEIGGHTIGHVDLATLSDADQRTAICNDMAALNGWGYDVHSFAYPYSSTGPNTQSIMAGGCPGIGTYESARAVGGLVSGTACSGCPWSETIPPGNPRYIATNDSVKSTTTLAQLQGYVTQAETTGGGWVPLIFHHVCDGCSTLAVSPATLDAFLTWLQARESQSTYVRTMHQVMTGDLPPPPPPPPLGSNQLINPSLEIGSNQASCWQRAGFGTNTATWTHTSDAHTGGFAEKVQITAYSTGDRKLVPKQDAGQVSGGCAPNVQAGAFYQLSAWYKSTKTTVVVVYYRDASGVWRYWRDGPLLPASASWTQMTYSPGAIPAGTQALSFGIALTSVGMLTTDDYSMALVLGQSAAP